MAMTRRPLIGVGAVAVVVTAALVFTLASAPPVRPDPSAAPSAGGSQAGAATDPPATPTPLPGHELFGFVPYWEMDGDDRRRTWPRRP